MAVYHHTRGGDALAVVSSRSLTYTLLYFQLYTTITGFWKHAVVLKTSKRVYLVTVARMSARKFHVVSGSDGEEMISY